MKLNIIPYFIIISPMLHMCIYVDNNKLNKLNKSNIEQYTTHLYEFIEKLIDLNFNTYYYNSHAYTIYNPMFDYLLKKFKLKKYLNKYHEHIIEIPIKSQISFLNLDKIFSYFVSHLFRDYVKL